MLAQMSMSMLSGSRDGTVRSLRWRLRRRGIRDNLNVIGRGAPGFFTIVVYSIYFAEPWYMRVNGMVRSYAACESHSVYRRTWTCTDTLTRACSEPESNRDCLAVQRSGSSRSCIHVAHRGPGGCATSPNVMRDWALLYLSCQRRSSRSITVHLIFVIITTVTKIS